MNVKKTHFMIFQPSRKKILSNPCIKIENEEIDRVKECKFLGVMLDEKLTWTSHILYIKSKVAKTIGVIRKARQVLGRAYLLSLYNTLILPYLMYCNIIWGSANQSTLLPLIKIQKNVNKMHMQSQSLCQHIYTFQRSQDSKT